MSTKIKKITKLTFEDQKRETAAFVEHFGAYHIFFFRSLFFQKSYDIFTNTYAKSIIFSSLIFVDILTLDIKL